MFVHDDHHRPSPASLLFPLPLERVYRAFLNQDFVILKLLFSFIWRSSYRLKYIGCGLCVAQLTVNSQISFVDLSPPDYINSNVSGLDGTQQVGDISSPILGTKAVLWAGSAGSIVDLTPSDAYEAWVYGAGGGQQVGVVRIGGNSLPALWSGSANSFRDLSPPGAVSGTLLATTGSQQVGVVNVFVDGLSYTQSHAGLWSGTADSFVDLNPLGVQGSGAHAIGSSTQVGFVEAEVSGWFGPQAALWIGTAASYVNLNPVGASFSLAKSISGSRQGGYAVIEDHNRAAVWSGTADSFVDLNPPGSTDSGIMGMSRDYQVGHANFGGQYHAVLWCGTAEPFVDLSLVLGSAYTSSSAYAISSTANTAWIGGVASDGSSSHAIMWTVDLGQLDIDSDGVPDAYERAHGMNPTDPSDSITDSDGDGLSNLEEYLAGTDPQDPADALGVSTIDLFGDDIQLGFKTVQGKIYRLEKSDVSPNGPWTVLGTPISGDGSAQAMLDHGGAAALKRFYRVIVQ